MELLLECAVGSEGVAMINGRFLNASDGDLNVRKNDPGGAVGFRSSGGLIWLLILTAFEL